MYSELFLSVRVIDSIKSESLDYCCQCL